MKLLMLLFAVMAFGQARIDTNVVYGMYSGTALLMDVHVPDRPNGIGVVFVAGSGWQAPFSYGAPMLKDQQIAEWRVPLLEAGFTLFAINHRAAPRFAYPAAVDDVQRAIRFIRHHSKKYGIDPNRLGGIGGSSGGHLISMAAMRQTAGIEGDNDPVNRQAAALQCVVLRAAPSDLAKIFGSSTPATAAVTSFLAAVPMTSDAQKIYREASPISHVTSNAPPVLLLHGDADDTVPFDQSAAMEKALLAQKAPVKLIRVAGGTHGHVFSSTATPHPQFANVMSETIAWLKQHLDAR